MYILHQIINCDQHLQQCLLEPSRGQPSSSFSASIRSRKRSTCSTKLHHFLQTWSNLNTWGTGDILWSTATTAATVREIFAINTHCQRFMWQFWTRHWQIRRVEVPNVQEKLRQRLTKSEGKSKRISSVLTFNQSKNKKNCYSAMKHPQGKLKCVFFTWRAHLEVCFDKFLVKSDFFELLVLK